MGLRLYVDIRIHLNKLLIFSQEFDLSLSTTLTASLLFLLPSRQRVCSCCRCCRRGSAGGCYHFRCHPTPSSLLPLPLLLLPLESLSLLTLSVPAAGIAVVVAAAAAAAAGVLVAPAAAVITVVVVVLLVLLLLQQLSAVEPRGKRKSQQQIRAARRSQNKIMNY